MTRARGLRGSAGRRAAGPTAAFEAATLLCTITYRLSDGQIVAAGAFRLDGSGELPIVGGTGAYARRTVTSARPAKGFDSADVLTIGD